MKSTTMMYVEPNRDLIGELSSIVDMADQEDNRPRGMVGNVYTSQSLFELELKVIFKQDWQCVGRFDELPKTGDYMTTTVGKTPVVVIRRSDGTLSALLNVCAHRLSKVVTGCGNARTLVCPYHGWAYAPDGKLLSATRMPADFDKSNHGLTQVPLEIWQGFVYVNLDRDAAPLAPRLAPLDEVFNRYGLSRYVTLNKEEEIWNTNWKIATENFMESYHLAIGHAATMGLNYPPNKMKMTDEGDDYAFHSMQTVDEFLIPLDPKIAMPNRPISEEDFRTLYAGGIFPNHLFTLAYDQAIWMRTQPLAVDKTLIQWGVCGAFEWPEGMGPDPSHPNQYFVPGMVPVNAEDKRITESVQAGAYSDVQPSELHKDEHGLYTFAKYLKRRLADSKPVSRDGLGQK